ncbi:MAG: hypothetical protein CL829_03560 [Crocinitomicaceae bacterium]|nr:hypothetical protein [Crocinitomicaceae bacterium]
MEQLPLTELTLPDASRVWVYTCNRIFSALERQEVEEALGAFLKGWAAHGKPLHAQAAVVLDQLVVLAVDESIQAATGCSIDASVSALKGLGSASPSLADLDLFDRSWVVHRNGGNDAQWSRMKLHEFWAQIKCGNVDPASVQVVDTTVTQLGDLRREGVKHVADSWHAEMW